VNDDGLYKFSLILTNSLWWCHW